MSDINIDSMQATARVTGKVTEVGKKEPAGRSEKQIIVVEFQDGRYTNSVALEFFGAATEKSADLRVGDRVRVVYSNRSRKKEGGDRWFNSNDAWDVEVMPAARAPARENRERPSPSHGHDDRPPPDDGDLYQ